MSGHNGNQKSEYHSLCIVSVNTQDESHSQREPDRVIMCDKNTTIKVLSMYVYCVWEMIDKLITNYFWG